MALLSATLNPAAGQKLAPTLAVALAEHRVDVGAGIEVSSGPIVAAGVQSRFGERWLASVELAAGPLSANGSGPDRDVAQARIAAGYRLARWVDLEAGFATRTYTATLARQRWTLVFAGAVARLPFAARGLRGVGRLAFLPVVRVSELPSPGPALTAAAGLECDMARFTVGLMYGVERYEFPVAGGVARRERLSALTLHATWRRAILRTRSSLWRTRPSSPIP